MRILVLTSFDIFPPVHGGSSIAYNFVKHASERHDVTALLSRLYSLGGDIDLQGKNLEVQYCEASVFDRFRVFSFLVNPHYYRKVESLCRERNPDVIQCETLWTALAGWRVARRCSLPWLYVAYNVETEKFAALGRPWAVCALVRAVERFVCHRADAIVTVSERDREALIARFGAARNHVKTISPSPDLAEFRFDAGAREAVRARHGLAAQQAMLTFVGNLRYEPNQEAVRHIAEDIGPEVIVPYPDARFVVIGQGCEMLSQHDRPWIIFTGYLSQRDLVAHLCATDVFLVPVMAGSGVRIKIPEATACGRAVVATREATAGLELFAENELMRVGDTGRQFVAAVLRLIGDPALRQSMGTRAHARTVAVYGWDRTLEAYEQVYRSMGVSC